MKKLHRYYLLIKLFPWFKFLKAQNSKSDIIIWIFPSFPKNIFSYISSSMFVKDLATINYHIKNKIPFKIVFGKNIGKYNNKKIYFSLGQYFNFHGFKNHTSVVHYLSNQLEQQGNILVPNSKEILYWENKLYMHQKFDELGIKTPISEILLTNNLPNNNSLNFPFLLKIPHSASSAGVFKIDNQLELYKLLSETFIADNPEIIKQELLNIKKDLRVTLVGEEIVLHYWRVNESKEWKPTSTSHGSKVDFITFPEKWRTHIVETFKKTGLSTGAFDVTWQNDDLETEPYFLEVSPTYSPNPNTEPEKYGVTYSQFKKKLKLNNSYLESYIKLVFAITEKHLNFLKEK
jgi:glutathione synthase/RimK-type ligase-like ATP-grasp enzyme